ncbi:Serine/threonine-protein phosphatase [Phytophthora cinnamomi]|uniref:Serine/threonine-protein phosphatase n=1 Tax=Phytophthora cinnamomi TaxID=4785 RepID=UPI00355A0BD4|nr:Serine/threonine-protein phosphatase [Phytophthora cinnamomi]
MGGMSSAQSQQDASSAVEERVHRSDDEYVVVESWDGPSPGKKRRRSHRGEAERDVQANGAAAGSETQRSNAEGKMQEEGAVVEENGRVDVEKETVEEQKDAGEVVSNGSAEKDTGADARGDEGQASSDEKQPESEGADGAEEKKHEPEQLLAYAFKNVDSDNDGFLSYSEVEHALGRGFLQMEDAIPATEMREMLQLMDRNGDEQISLREFVHYFAVGEREVATNLIDNARKKELAALHAKRTVELTPRDVIDPLFAQRRGVV